MSRNKLYVLHAHDNEFKSTITAVATYIMTHEVSNIDTVNTNTIYAKINSLKQLQNEQIYHFATIPKDIFYLITDDNSMSEVTGVDKSKKELIRSMFVEWVENQKIIFGSNVWARKVVNSINLNRKKFKQFWIGDLRSLEELQEIQKNINVLFDVKFIYVEINAIPSKVYYKKQDLNTKNFQYKITIDSTKSYQDILNDVYYQLKGIIK